jgi:integrase/recombinase XerD
MKQRLKNYGDYLLVKKGLGEVTIVGYKASIRIVLKRLKTLEPTEQQIIDYIVWMYEKKYSYNHIVNTSLAIEWYFKFQGKVLKLGRPKKPKRLIKDTLTEAEVTKIIQATKNIREKAILALLAYSGIRNQELCNLRVCDVMLGDNLIRILKGKGFKDRIIHISGECCSILLEYLNHYPRNSEEYFFTTLLKGRRYNENDLRKLVKVVSMRARLNKRVYPHLFRHSLATNLLKRGANITLIQRQLGHEGVESTLIYLRTYPQRIQNEYNLFIPSYL